MLELTGVEVRYGQLVALRDMSMKVEEGEFVAILGSNASGKSTLLKSIAGLVSISSGRIVFEGDDLTSAPSHHRVARGIVLVPEGRHILPYMSVEENLRLGAWSKHLRPEIDTRLKYVYGLIPRLAERRSQLGGSFSGGEQQMLAIGRALMSQPKLLLLDEPSLGLSPIMLILIFDLIKRIREEGTTILMVEQNVHLAMEIAERAYVIANTMCVKNGRTEDLRVDEDIRRAYMGL